jgi:hypothetical protein
MRSGELTGLLWGMVQGDKMPGPGSESKMSSANMFAMLDKDNKKKREKEEKRKEKERRVRDNSSRDPSHGSQLAPTTPSTPKLAPTLAAASRIQHRAPHSLECPSHIHPYQQRAAAMHTVTDDPRPAAHHGCGAVRVGRRRRSRRSGRRRWCTRRP